MRKISIILVAIFLSSCDIGGVAPQPFPVQSPIPSSTPAIFTATPFIIPPPVLNFTPTGTILTAPSSTADAAPPTPTIITVLPSPTDTQPVIQATEVEILGCNTSFDIRNGMGEVTNAYVRIKNTGTVNLPNMCALLRAIDERREHPDKKVCASNLPVNNQVALKLTVDSTYKKDTIIQVDVTSNETLLLRVDRQSCRDISLFGGVPTDIGVVKPIP
ncbi:MAG: hypothetical protein OHK003_15210 [Anaerolineales bacterium]